MLKLRHLSRKIIKILAKYALYLSFLQVWAATLGSLYFSEVANLNPCVLCWYQRALMYPLAIIFTVAIIRKDQKVGYYVLPISILGASIGFYQYLLQMTPLSKSNPISCGPLASCSQIDQIYFGFITIPLLSMVAFLVVTVLMLILLLNKEKI